MKHQVERAEPDGSVTFFENLILFVLLIVMLAALMPGCASPRSTAITTGSDNATMTADSGLTIEKLIEYVHMAENEALAASQLYESTRDATALQKAAYWLQYASGVAVKLDALTASSD